MMLKNPFKLWLAKHQKLQNVGTADRSYEVTRNDAIDQHQFDVGLEAFEDLRLTDKLKPYKYLHESAYKRSFQPGTVLSRTTIHEAEDGKEDEGDD